jgi:hypothetical protein
MRKLAFASAIVAAAAIAGSAQGAVNLVTNGDFEAGNTGFGSDYLYNVPTDGQAQYSITTNPRLVHPAFAIFGDHTTGVGNMMVVNGSDSTTDRVWFQNGIGINANTTYFFSTWIRTVFDQAPAQLKFSININSIGTTFTAGSIADGWQQFSASWNSGAATTADISLVNQNTAFSGNDFALDDISLSVTAPGGGVPEPASWALMIAGFGLAGATLRRRQRGAVRA